MCTAIAVLYISLATDVCPVNPHSRLALAWPLLHCCCRWMLGLPPAASTLLLWSLQWSCEARGRVTEPALRSAEEEGHPHHFRLHWQHSLGSTACRLHQHWGQCSGPGAHCWASPLASLVTPWSVVGCGDWGPSKVTSSGTCTCAQWINNAHNIMFYLYALIKEHSSYLYTVGTSRSGVGGVYCTCKPCMQVGRVYIASTHTSHCKAWHDWTLCS